MQLWHELNIHILYETHSKIYGSFDRVSYMLCVIGCCMYTGHHLPLLLLSSLCNYMTLSVVVAVSAHMIQTMCQ